MGERQNTIVCVFDLNSPRISAYEIHEWIYVQLKLEDEEVLLVQIDGPQRHVYIKLRDANRVREVLHRTDGQAEYRHTNGVISKVRVETAGLGTRRVRVANLPPEVPEEVLRTMMTRYGDVKDVQVETWSRIYRYKVSNGVRVVMMSLAKHIPSTITIAGHRVLVSYEGQPMTCYRCQEAGHFHQTCPMRRRVVQMGHTGATTSWADVAAAGQQHTRQDTVEGDKVDHLLVHKDSIEREPERESGEQVENVQTSKPREQGPYTTPEQENTSRSDNMDIENPREIVPSQSEEIRVDCESEKQGRQTLEERKVSYIPHPPQEGYLSEVEARGSGEEAVEAESWSAMDALDPTVEGDSTASHPTRPKRLKKLKVARRASPPSERSRSRVRNVTKLV